MIRRRRVYVRQEDAQNGQGEVEYQWHRKGSIGRVNRFNYAVQSFTPHENNGQSFSRDQSFTLYSTLNPNEPLNQTIAIPQQPPCRLKKGYLYCNSKQIQPFLHQRDLNLSNESYQGRQSRQNSIFEGRPAKSTPFQGQNFLSDSYLRRNMLYPDPSLDLTDQSAISATGLDCSLTSESLELQYQQTYANNQRQKGRSVSKDIPELSLQVQMERSENTVINSKHFRRRAALLQNQTSINRTESSLGNHTKRQTNQSASKQPFRGTETRKTSPNRTFKTRYTSEIATLRVSPVKRSPTPSETDASLRLIEELSVRVWSRMEELNGLLASVRVK